MGPGSVHMADAEGSDISQDYSDMSSEYSYSSNDEADLGLAEASTAKERPPYRIIDADLLKKVQVRSQLLLTALHRQQHHAPSEKHPTMQLQYPVCVLCIGCMTIHSHTYCTLEWITERVGLVCHCPAG
jgi:hypothetical protein